MNSAHLTTTSSKRVIGTRCRSCHHYSGRPTAQLDQSWGTRSPNRRSENLPAKDPFNIPGANVRHVGPQSASRLTSGGRNTRTCPQREHHPTGGGGLQIQHV